MARKDSSGQSSAEVKTHPAAPASLGLDDAALSADVHGDNAPPLVMARGEQGDQGRPFCEKHNVLMRAYSTKPDSTHYKCPVDGCNERKKLARPTLHIPLEPQMCPQKTCRDGEGRKLMALEVDARLSKQSAAQLHMKCPGCGFNVKVPRPQFNATLARTRMGADEDLATR